MKNFYLYRNCYTSGVAGGDVHTNKVYSQLLQDQKDLSVTCIKPKHDNQEYAYPELSNFNLLEYRNIPYFNKFPFISFLIRTFFACTLKKFSDISGIHIASSHFIPDILPAIFASRRAKNSNRVVYIHHIISDMDRKLDLNNLFAILQEKVSFFLIRKKFGVIIVVNKLVKTRLIEMGFESGTILVSGNSIDKSYMNTKPVNYGDKNIDIVFCGRLIHQKGVYDFIKTVKKISQLHPNIKAVMIGDGPEKTNIKKKIEQYKVPIDVKGFVNEEIKIKIINNSKIMLFPSVEEGWGIAVAESLSLGVPVVCYKLDVYDAIFKNQLLGVPLNNQNELFSRVNNLLNHYNKHESEYDDMQQRLKKFAFKFDLQKISKEQFNFILDE